MPPKKAVKKKKKVAEVKEPPFPIPRDVADTAPIDGLDGALGLEHLAISERIREVKALLQDLVLWKISEAVRLGELDLSLADHGLDSLPEELVDVPWLQVLDLSKNRFVNSVFAQLKALPGLRALDLSVNLLNGPLSDDAGGALPADLEELSVDENVLTALPETLAGLKKMTWFSARKNLLPAIPPACLASWGAMHHLDLRNNKLKALPEEISGCTSLVELLLDNNELEALPAGIGKLENLQLLSVRKNALVDVPDAIRGCIALVDIELGFNKLPALPDGLFEGCTKLETLSAPSNKISALQPSIGGLASLRVLNIAGNVVGSLPEEMGSLVRLRELYVNGNPLTALPASATAWEMIEEAGFKGCKLKAIGPEVSKAWTSIKVLDVRGKKKDTCKVVPEFKDEPAMRKAFVKGIVVAKVKKKAAPKKK